MFEKAQFTWVNEHFEAIFDKDLSSTAITRQRLCIRIRKGRHIAFPGWRICKLVYRTVRFKLAEVSNGIFYDICGLSLIHI